jgi:hypothetical protein
MKTFDYWFEILCKKMGTTPEQLTEESKKHGKEKEIDECKQFIKDIQKDARGY